MIEKKHLLVLFGGVSSEHEISRLSAASILRNIREDKYEVIKVGITKDGKWIKTEADTDEIENGQWENHPDNTGVLMNLDFSGTLLIKGEKLHIDVAFPILHGKNGEDGRMQSVLQIAGIPFVGSDSTSSAACMDKGITKAMVEQADICDQAKCCIVNKGCDIDESMQVISEFFFDKYPLFVKPANAGSSVGISKVKKFEDLRAALEMAFAEDKRVLVEEAIVGREIEVAVIGNTGTLNADSEPKASRIGEIFAANEFYDYQAKYENASSRTGMVTDLPEELEEQIREVAVSIYQVMGCRGLARVDFFLEPGESGGFDDGHLVFNEINTLPGFTSISMYPKIWVASGLPYSEQIDTLIELAMED